MIDLPPYIEANIHPELLTRFARLNIVWAYVESMLAEFLSFLLEANRGYMYVINQSMAAEAQLKWIRTLAERYDNPDTQAGLSSLFQRIDETRIDRNALVHGLWIGGSQPQTAAVQTVKITRKEIVVSELVTCADLDDLLGDAREIAAELDWLADKLGFLAVAEKAKP